MSSKSRFDGLDCKAMAAHLQKQLAGRRVVNIYNGGNGETYIFKLDNTNADGDGKSFLVLESGLRFHTLTEFQAIDSMPSPFCAKLRKHLRGLRLEHIQQLGKSDRVVLFQWGAGSSRHTIILELYAKGNIILTDKDFVVLALLRSHVYQATTAAPTKEASPNTIKVSEEDTNRTAAPNNNKEKIKKVVNNDTVAVQVGQVFPVSYAATIETTTATSDTGPQDGNTTIAAAAEATTTAVTFSTAADFNAWAVQHIRQTASWQKNSTTGKKKESKNKNNCTLKTLLLQNSDSGVSHFGPGLIEHCIRVADCDPNMNLVQRLEQMETNPAEATTPPLVAIWSDDEWARLKGALQKEGQSILDSLELVHENDGPPGGYILYQPRKVGNHSATSEAIASTNDVLPHADKLLLEFQPILLRQHEHCPVLKYDTFDQAVQDFFRHLEHQKALSKAQSAEQAAAARLDKVRADQEERVRQLEAQQLVWQQQAATVQQHAANVDQVLQVVNSALDSGMDWDQLEQVVHVEQKQNRNPIALLIHRLELEHEAMVLRLPTQTTDLAQYFASHSMSTEPTLDVRVSLHESAFGNASALFAKYRSSKEKSQKTVEASTKALKAAEETARKQLAEAQKRQQHTVSGAVGKRKVLWFEKFHWFVTSDNYLVIAGRDAHQNELLVKRYLRPGDAYLHADVHGAASVILRAKRRRRRNIDSGGTDVLPLSEQALREAGHFTICRSSAWASRMITSAWWVEAHQVSKTAPTGEYLTVGSFMIRGKKQFLPPTPLEMGIGVLFVLGDDDSIRRHANERRDLALLGLEDDDSDDDEATAAVVDENDNFPVEEQNDNRHASRETTRREVVDLSDRSKPAERSDDQRRAGRVGDGDDNHIASAIVSTPEADGHDEMEKVAGEEPTEENDGNNEDKPKKKKGLSARDRRLIRKHGSLEAAEMALSAKDEEPVDEAPITAESTSTTSDAHKLVKRGRKAKQKKMMTKYADQDEEDRELAMQALQGGEKVNKKKTPGSKRRDTKVSVKQQEVAAETVALLTKDASTVAAKLADEVRQQLAECVMVYNNNGKSQEEGGALVRWDKLDAETIEQLMSLEPLEAQVAAARRLLELKQTTRIDNFSSSLGGIIRTIRKHGYKDLGQVADGGKSKAQKSREEEDKDASKWKQTMEAEGAVADDVDEDAVDDTTELNKLTCKPQPEDLILSAVPICAPYHTLSQYVYRVKLTPGNMKRGKASKQCVDMLLKTTKNASEGIDRQLDLIKRVGDNDWVQVICGDVKIAAAGASKLVKQNKTKNKLKVKSGK